MQTIEQIPPETKKPETFTDEELASLALAETQPAQAPVVKPGSSVARAEFWAVGILVILAVGPVTLAMIAVPIIGC